MSSYYLLGVDIGTYSSKGVVVKETGEVVASHIVEHNLDMPKPGYYEHDPEKVWWNDFLQICHTLLYKYEIDPRKIIGIGISTISPAIVPIDENGRALRPAILYGIDTRATKEISELSQLTGVKLTSQSAAPKILWIKRNEPEIWSKTRWILNGAGYINFKLTNKVTIDIYDASLFVPLFDFNTLKWSEEIASFVIPINKLPLPMWSCDITGYVTSEAAQVTGLLAGTPVITGTADAAAEAVSAGLSEPGDMMIMYGSSTFFIAKVAQLRDVPNFWSSPFLEKGSYVVTGGTATAGSLTRWFRDQFGYPELEAERSGKGNAYALLAGLAETSTVGGNGLIILPYFAGERTPLHDPEAKGVIFGLTLRHTRADIYRAILESVGYSIRHNIEELKKEGINIQRILAVGGGTQNTVWMQIISDIANIIQQIPEKQIGASYGDAFMAGVGVGLFSTVKEVTKWVKISRTITPNIENYYRYEHYYQIFKELYKNTVHLMHQIG